MNINIAICDDEIHQTEYMHSLVNKWAEQNHIHAYIQSFDSAEDFQSAYNKQQNYDILLLDIMMGGKSGIELAKDLRKIDHSLIIIFITAVTDYLQEGYEVSALHYLIKPIKEDKLYDTLNKALQSLAIEKKFLIINSENKTCRILLDGIIYIEASRNNILIITEHEGKYEVRQNISHIEKELDYRFFRCQRSYIVMLKHVKHISKTEVLLDNGKIISLSRNIYKELYQAFIQYHKTERGKT